MKVKDLKTILDMLPQELDVKLLTPEQMVFCDMCCCDIHLEFEDDNKTPFIGLGYLE